MVIFAGLCYGFLPVFALFGYQGGANEFSFMFLRYGIIFLFMYPYLWLTSGRPRWKLSELGAVLLVGGLLNPLMSLGYICSFRYIQASLSVLLFYTYPVLVAVLSFCWGRERIGWRTLLAILVCCAGLVLVVGTSWGSINLYGVGLALFSALCCAFSVVISSRILEQMDEYRYIACSALFTAAALALSGAAWGKLPLHLTGGGWLAAVACGVTGTLAMFNFYRGLNLVGSTNASLLCMVEPLTAVVATALIFSQRLTLMQLLGGLVILLGAVLVVTSKS